MMHRLEAILGRLSSSSWIWELRMLQYVPLGESISHLFVQLVIAIQLTAQTFYVWLLVMLHLLKTIVHALFISSPYVSPYISTLYNIWKSLELSTKLIIICGICAIIFSLWLRAHVRQRKYIQKINTRLLEIKHKIQSHYRNLLARINAQSQFLASIFPHLLWFTTFLVIFWFVKLESVHNLHDTAFVFITLLIPCLCTYHTLMYNHENINFWLRFWVSRALLLMAFHCMITVASNSFFVRLGYYTGFSETKETSHSSIVEYLEWLQYWCILWCYFPLTSGCDLISSSVLQMIGIDPVAKNELQTIQTTNDNKSINDNHRSISSHISLQALNSLLTFSLSLIRPFISTRMHDYIQNAFYQFAIFLLCAFISPRLGCYLLGYCLAIYTSVTVVNTYDQYNFELKNMWNILQSKNIPIQSTLSHNNVSSSSGNQSQTLDEKKRETHEKQQETPFSTLKSSENPSQEINVHPTQRYRFRTSSFLTNVINGVKEWTMRDQNDPFWKEKKEWETLETMCQEWKQGVIFWIKYWVVFSVFEWICDALMDTGLSTLSLMYLVKLICILWLQLPFVPMMDTNLLYDYVVLPWRIMDMSHMSKKKKQPKDEPTDTDNQNKTINYIKTQIDQ